MGKNQNAIAKRRAAKKARREADRLERRSLPSTAAAVPTRLTNSGPVLYTGVGEAPMIISTSGRAPVIVTRDDIERVARMVSDDPLGLAWLEPESDAQPRDCINNVDRKVARDGGRPRYGWTFNPRPGPAGPYVILAHHAVWHATDLRLVDITPPDPDERLRPIMEDDATLFLVDVSAQPIPTKVGPAARPSCAFPLNNDRALARYVAEWNDKEQRECEANCARANSFEEDAVGTTGDEAPRQG